MLKFLVIALIALLVIIMLFVALIFFLRRQYGRSTKITSENGIQENAFVKLGRLQQFISIRGQNTSNPVILILHGGPGSPISLVGYHWQTGLESYYTLVNWEQRGCGRTYFENLAKKTKSKTVTKTTTESTSKTILETASKSAPNSSSASVLPNPPPDYDPAKDLSLDLLLGDLDELVDYLRERFGQEKIIIMGHSWGTVLGSMYVQRHPEKAASYIGVGQAVDMPAADLLAKNTAVLRAEAKGDLRYIDKVTAQYDIVASAKASDMDNFMKMRSLTSKYLVCSGAMPDWKMIWTGIISPDMSFRDLRWQLIPMTNIKKYFELQAPLMPILFDFNIYETGSKYEIPVYLISGDGDWITPYPLVRKFAKTLTAPKKEMILLENTGHNPFLDNPKAFCKAVRKVLK